MHRYFCITSNCTFVNSFRTPTILFAFHEGDANILCDRGIDDPLIAIKPYLEKAWWKKTVNEYFYTQYEFEKAGIDFDLLGKIKIINENEWKELIEKRG